MADMEPNLLQVLKLVRAGTIKYGTDTGYANLLAPYAKRVGLDPALADPARGMLPCLLVHGGIEGCANHKAALWKKGF
ncbi:hypothetical protein BDK51DRAFT_13332, partial [Blyttiomyces helicus]